MLMNPTDSVRPYTAGLVALIVLFAAVNGYYFVKSQTPTFWDDSSYLIGSLDLYDALYQRGVPGFIGAFAHLYGNKAPLICAFATPVYLLLGRTTDPRFMVGLFFLILSSIYLFRLAKELWSPREGLLAVAIVQTMPLFYGLSRQYLVDYGLAALVIMWMYYLVIVRTSSHIFPSVCLSVLFGVGLLMKVTFPLYVVAPTVIVFWMLWRDAREFSAKLKVIGRFGYIILAGALIAAVWYVPNLKSILEFAASAGYGKLSVNYGSAAVFSATVVLQYLMVLIVVALSSYFTFLLIALVPVWASRLRSPKRLTGSGYSLMLLSWALLPLFVTTLAVNKDPRYTAPVLPVAGLCMARLIIGTFGENRWLLAITGGLMVVPAFAYASSSVPFVGRAGDWRLGPFVMWSSRLAWYASAPGREGAWHQTAIIDALCADARKSQPGARVLIPLAHQYLNSANLEYLARKRLGCDLQIIGLPPELDTPQRVAEWIAAVKPYYAVVIPDVPQPDLAPPFVNVMKAEAERSIAGSGFVLFHRESMGATGKDFLIYRRS